jgi:alkylation response protein AidB-like acyl-CoA dehydrogenase
MPISKEYGGRNADPITTISIMEGLGYGGTDQGLLFSINAHLWTKFDPPTQYGTDEQEKRDLPGVRRKSHWREWHQRTERWLGYFFHADPRHDRRQ